MARVTIQDCLEQENNRFRLVRVASKRAKDLLNGKESLVDPGDNKSVVSALREIADGKVQSNLSSDDDTEAPSVDAEQFFANIKEHTS